MATSGLTRAGDATHSPATGATVRGSSPQTGLTRFGTPVTLGNGRAWTYTTVDPATRRVAHGLYFQRAALQGLPSADDLATAGPDQFTEKYGPTGEALRIHHEWSLEFFVPLPPTATTPCTFIGLNWNPGGHPPAGVWTVPHVDVHFHVYPPWIVDAISGPRAPTYDLPARFVPDGYDRPPTVDERVITDMGEHLYDPSIPELNGGAFTNTLIWGVGDPNGDGVAAQTFVEPMVAREYLRNHRGVDRRPIPQPATYATEGAYPTAYAVRDVPSRDALVIEIDGFERAAGDA